jgi:hypothetical protein
MTALPTPNGMDFPERRDAVHGSWSPIYVEPVIGSGERICVGVAAVNGSASLVVPVVALDRLECLYGKGVDAILLASRVALEYTRGALGDQGAGALQRWKAPMDGLYLGDSVRCAGDTLEEIARTGLTAASSLVEKLADAEEETEGRGAGLTTSRLEELIKQKVVTARPPLEARFRVQRRVRDNARASVIGFIGDKIAANFGMLLPGRLGPLVNVSKAKLWDLAQLREDVKRGDLFSPPLNRFELLVYRPREESPEYSIRQLNAIQEAVVELEAEADQVQIMCRPATSPEQIAETLLQAEAA